MHRVLLREPAQSFNVVTEPGAWDSPKIHLTGVLSAAMVCRVNCHLNLLLSKALLLCGAAAGF
jgi:hypothetical protein